MSYQGGGGSRKSESAKRKKERREEKLNDELDQQHYRVQQSGPAPQHVKTSRGTWCATTYDSLCGSASGFDIVCGANIELHFSPSTGLTATRNIRIIQFVQPIIAATQTTSAGWAVDKSATAVVPYLGMEDEHTPMKIAWKFPRYVDRNWRNCIMAGTGQITNDGHNLLEAWCRDPPRELCRRTQLPPGSSKTSTFATYAYDEDNECWLGGVAWGYTVWVDEKNNPQVSLLEIRSRSNGALLQEELDAAILWNSQVVPDRLPISLLQLNGAVWGEAS